jgi:hypothetical protein
MAWAKQSSVIGTIENVKAASAKDSFRGAMADSLRGWQALSPPKTVRIFRLPEVSDGELQARFEKLVSTWEEDTAFTSALDEMVLHQDYQDIIGMGFQALPYIFARLEASPARWFWALRSIVGVDVAANATSADEAVARWRDWAIANGYTA